METLTPKFVFKQRYEDAATKAWVYAYYIPWHTSLVTGGIKMQPQQSEIDMVMWMSPEQIEQKIKQGSKITPDSVAVF